MRATIAFTEAMFSEIRAALNSEVESAAILHANRVAGPEGDVTLLVADIRWMPETSYVTRLADEMVIDAGGWYPAVAEAAANHNVPIFLHTHPGARATPSRRDAEVNDIIEGAFRTRGGVQEFVSLVIGGSSSGPEVDGEIRADDRTRNRLRAVRIVGDRLNIVLPQDLDASVPAPTYDRQVRAFGKDGQMLLHALRAGVAGVGGTGSAVCEQLIRLGVGELVVVDPNELKDHNVSRVYGSSTADCGRPKVDLVFEAAARLGLGTRVTPIRSLVNDPRALSHLRQCDVVFGCTDDNAGRITLSRLAYYYLLPVIDCGVVIEANGPSVTGVFGRNTFVGPGAACLMCTQTVDTERARSENMDPESRNRAIAEGYLPQLGDPDPSVVSYTTLVASWSVSELLHRLFGLEAGLAPTGITHRIHLHQSSPNRATPRSGCYCTDVKIIGAGDAAPMLGIAGL